MQIIPEIFIQNGKVVSLYKGSDNPEKKVYPKSPASYAKLWQSQGANIIFVMDLDGNQQERLFEIRAAFDGEIWWAGQIHNMEKATSLLTSGADKIVLGQSAEPIFTEALETFGPEKIIAGMRVKHYDAAPDFCETLGKFGFTQILVHDLNAEGTLFHPNFDLMEKCAYFSGVDVYASGGVSEERHIPLLAKAGVKAVVVGRALYENHLSLERLINLV